MKLIPSLLSLTLAIAFIFCMTPTAGANPYFGGHSSHGGHSGYGGHSSHGGHSGYGGHSSHGGHSGYGHPSSRYKAPVRLLYTREIGRRTHYQVTRNRYGRPHNQRVTTITYKATYSNGQTKIYTRTV